MSIGEALASARQESGLTVDDVAQATRIRGTLIRAIEHDDFSLCGGAVYARGHIRSIGRCVGVDPEPLVADYDAQHGTAPLPVTESIFEVETKAKPERTGPRWGSAMIAAALAVICAVALASIFTSRSNGRGPAAAEGTPSATPSAGTGQPSAHPSPSRSASHTLPPGAVALNDAKGVNIRLRVTDARSWVSVSNSAGATLFQGLLNRGQVKDFKDPRELRLVVGAPAVTDLIVNGKDLGPAGPAGPVVHLVFHPGDPSKQSQG